MNKKYLPYIIVAALFTVFGIALSFVFHLARIIGILIGIVIGLTVIGLGIRKVLSIGKSTTPRD